mgnify:CR=1 FL=1
MTTPTIQEKSNECIMHLMGPNEMIAVRFIEKERSSARRSTYVSNVEHVIGQLFGLCEEGQQVLSGSEWTANVMTSLAPSSPSRIRR